MFNAFYHLIRKHCTIGQSMRLNLVLFCVSCVLMGWMACDTLRLSGVGGKYYQEVIERKDLVADILPPPAFILETHLLMHDFAIEMRLSTDEIATRLAVLKADFKKRHAHWDDVLPTGSMRDNFMEKASPAAFQYFELAEQMVAAAQRDEDRSHLWEKHQDALHTLFETHLSAIREVVQQASAQALVAETEASSLASTRIGQLLIWGFIILGFVIALALGISHHVTQRIQETSQLMKHVAAGDLDKRMLSSGIDEFDEMANFVNQAIAASKANLERSQHATQTAQALLDELGTQKNLLGGILTSTPDAILSLNDQLQIIEFNPAAEKLLGYPRAEVMNRSILDLEIFRVEDFARQYESTEVSSCGEQRYETAVKHQSGHQVPVSMAISSTEVKECSLHTISLMDLTEQIEVRKKIDSLARFPDEVPGPVVRVAFDGVVLYSNSPARTYLKSWNVESGNLISEEAQTHIDHLVKTGSSLIVEKQIDDHSFSILMAPVEEYGYVNLYATDITERKRLERERQELNDKLISTARQAGMAEFATGVLHNVGNVLNGVNVTTTILRDSLASSRTTRVADVAKLIKENEHSLASFFTSDPRGTRLPGYLSKLAGQIQEEHDKFESELKSLSKHVEHIKAIVATQQSVASTAGLIQPCHLSEVIDDAIGYQLSSFDKYGIELLREYEDFPELMVDKQKLLQILVNFIKNAKEAVRDSQNDDRRVDVRLWKSSEETFSISVCDTGVGIPPELIDQIFVHGFTTKADGHGFGLHSCANYAREMGGRLKISSEGPGKGANFTIELPFKPSTMANTYYEYAAH